MLRRLKNDRTVIFYSPGTVCLAVHRRHPRPRMVHPIIPELGKIPPRHHEAMDEDERRKL